MPGSLIIPKPLSRVVGRLSACLVKAGQKMEPASRSPATNDSLPHFPAESSPAASGQLDQIPMPYRFCRSMLGCRIGAFTMPSITRANASAAAPMMKSTS